MGWVFGIGVVLFVLGIMVCWAQMMSSRPLSRTEEFAGAVPLLLGAAMILGSVCVWVWRLFQTIPH